MTSINLEVLSQEQKNIPDFVLKLYCILQNTQFENVIAWTNNGCELQVKNQKKLQTNVLPIYFRHKKIQSFIRQLNMYRFGKVNKIGHESRGLFFKNNLFQKDNLHLLHLITRKKKGQQDQDPTLDKGLQEYKIFIKQNVKKIQQDLSKLKNNCPQISSELLQILSFTQTLIGQSYQCKGEVRASTLSTIVNENPQSFIITYENFQENQFLKLFDSKYSIDIDLPLK